MQRLNYQHLFYFWTVAKEGSVSRASEKLHLAQPTVSAQLALFEGTIGEKLFHRDARKLALTETGRGVFHYADEIFALGRELTGFLNGRGGGPMQRLTVGIADGLPKLLAYRLLEPALRLVGPLRLICHEDKPERLLAEIALHGVDLVLSDVPATPTAGLRVFNHPLGESEVGVFGTQDLVERYVRDFPRSLNGAPFLLPSGGLALRRSLDQWFDAENLSPNIRAEIEDSALLKTFGGAGVGLFVAPILVEEEIRRQYRVELLGVAGGVRERFYAISAQRKIQHPAVVAILEQAQAKQG
ncbi:LysR family transcriptional regulator, transcriptional activator of nhaA [Methylomagnum ishizawai]|uniref:LysR family transcriptional regulator, transcriptional activator of nhaA n=1 Tax=Methylomagnum ishizawai TaxID=1760988 RepID=A0A1Y6DDU2_9GAMM|nr:transcriptional activator NhaR [Methylomagnum ishizawai]SMF97635.1 LysR family transcriptional regulator, transcriptional activator of nhaA [Methylomagnum ishizawai]